MAEARKATGGIADEEQNMSKETKSPITLDPPRTHNAVGLAKTVEILQEVAGGPKALDTKTAEKMALALYQHPDFVHCLSTISH